eukprot:CAMPEP_0202906108 /NCGR_PEP_ID=MMETSP1392-20130828/37360_1 /ASSEMBLY_ACC=CAM_ASM_000868 /TAXON_ID=225041 /ORGANISM="Chlamydomonas chlamydogama, Strain SAG 11-48b" /LENGTH=45 /DNA_ID= /DNA_START= /DNA_END= /DNA_ORIENTATION=
MDVASLAKQLGIVNKEVVARGSELVRMASVKVPGGLGQGEVCKAA